ncbi:MAG: hypothetical protein Q4A78_09530 [Peptostreptococcaceae bacterium]|nr:hypothetical protein [Peptostreptococcaceae bacterium]
MKKLRAMLTFVMAFTLLLTSISNAEGYTSEKEIRITAPYIEGVRTVDPVPKLDHKRISFYKMLRSGQNPVVTASDVGLYSRGGKYYAKGYVTMKDGKNDFYHYTRAELEIATFMSIVSDEVWGYGKVWAETKPDRYKGTASIHYGW